MSEKQINAIDRLSGLPYGEGSDSSDQDNPQEPVSEDRKGFKKVKEDKSNVPVVINRLRS